MINHQIVGMPHVHTNLYGIAIRLGDVRVWIVRNRPDKSVEMLVFWHQTWVPSKEFIFLKAQHI